MARIFYGIVLIFVLCLDVRMSDVKCVLSSGGYVLDTSFVLPLTGWYEKNRRALPWRETKDPYRIWLSEIMLQQTRVEAVKAYYTRFLATLPTIADLAAADEETILKLWEGLGYYSRVRNMQKAAQYVMTHYSGVLPADYDALLALPGIGAYTAGAIASFAFDLPYAAVDGNVLRVMSRIAGDMRDIALDATKKAWKQYMETTLLTRSNAAVLNQALMELGACVCLHAEVRSLPCSRLLHCLQTAAAAYVSGQKWEKASKNRTFTCVLYFMWEQNCHP